MLSVSSLFKTVLALLVIFILIIAGAAAFAIYHYNPNLPDPDELRDIRLQTPLRIFSADGKLIAEYGEQRRVPISYDDIPLQMKHAILAAEDSRFYEHSGIDLKGLARAAFQLVTSGDIQTGGSTITMQVAKNYFLTPDRTFERKFNEILLSLKIDQNFTKEEIFELYVNKIYLGQRAYGIQAASQIYYGKDINNLSLAEIATIAGLPKAPSANNPIRNPERSIERRNWILSRMLLLGYIDKDEYEQAISEPETARYHTADIELHAFYVAEMVRSEMVRTFGENAYTEGFNVITTIDSKKQIAADQALRNGLIAYHERHGYHGPEDNIDISELSDSEKLNKLTSFPLFGNMHPALVIELSERTATLLLRDNTTIELGWDGIRWARAYRTVNSMGPAPQRSSDVLSKGDIVRVFQKQEGQGPVWRLTQLPRVQSGLIAMEPTTGAIVALSGGFSFNHNNFNRVTQAWRQPGSTFKPFLYAVALENGYTASSIVNDSPIVMYDVSLGGLWRPENHNRTFEGPIRLREALYKSKNLASIRLLRDLDVKKAYNHILKFGFEPSRTPATLSLALGAGDATLLQVNTAYAALANGGYKVQPWFIDSVFINDILVEIPENSGESFKQTNTTLNHTNREELRIIKDSTAYIITDILADVIRQGTGRRALSLNRNDLAGKTGTTNRQRDAWFSGYNSEIVATTWLGFDQPSHLGRNEYGGTAALPIWIDFMGVALSNSEPAPLVRPSTVVEARVDRFSGFITSSQSSNAIVEIFAEDALPRRPPPPAVRPNNVRSAIEDLFD